MAQVTGSIIKYPARVSFAWYLGLILVGGLVLTRPISYQADRTPISPVDAVFTATSAACVTGLAVRSTGNDFSPFGQAVILLLIQVGGVGIITLTTYITFRFGAAGELRTRAAVAETLGPTESPDIGRLLGYVIRVTFLVEAMGFLILFAWWSLYYEQPLPTAAWYALFHSVSAFCNAGFSPFDDNIIGFQSDPVINFTIMALIVIGGIGFPVLLDLSQNWYGTWSRLWDRLHIHTKMMLLGTVFLLVAGWGAILALEWDNALRDMPLGTKLLAAAFQAVVPRTAGFNSVNIASLTNATLFIIMLLMAIGAGPCSTGGGFKVSSLMMLAARVWTAFHGQARVNVFRRTIPFETLAKATSVVLVFAVVITLGTVALLVVEQADVPHSESSGEFLDAMFEVISALGTVGLSTGITPLLSDAGKLVLVALMFLGRLGPITVFAALSRAERRGLLEYPSEEPLTG